MKLSHKLKQLKANSHVAEDRRIYIYSTNAEWTPYNHDIEKSELDDDTIKHYENNDFEVGFSESKKDAYCIGVDW